MSDVGAESVPSAEDTDVETEHFDNDDYGIDLPDRIELNGLRLVGICGTLPEERERPQPLEVDLEVEVDLGEAALSDDLADTVNYGDLCQAAADVVEASDAYLLEHLASLIAAAVLVQDDRIESVTVGLRKLNPPVPFMLESSGVRITRRA